MTQAISNLVGQALTETQTQPTQTKPANINAAFNLMANMGFPIAFETLGDPHLETLLMATVGFCFNLDDERTPHWQTFLGATGNGKTYLARQIYQFAKRHPAPRSAVPSRTKYPWESLIDGMRVQWVDWRKLCDDLNNGQWHRVDEICDAWFVVLDDIGTEYDPKGMLKNKLDRILNSRLGMWTVITSNLFYDQIATQLDVRIASRMKRSGSVVVETNTLDYALRQ